MKKFTRIAASIGLVALFSSLVVSTAFAFADVPVTAYYYTAVTTLATDGVLDATQENFMPTALYQRDQAAKVLVLDAGITPLENPATPTFTDVPKTAWSYQYVETAAAHQIVSGYASKPGYFGPGDPVTREQYAKMIVEAFGWDLVNPETPTFTDVPATNPMYQYVETAYHWSVINGMTATTFAPTANIIRGDAALMAYRAKYEAVERADDDDDTDDTADDDDDDDDDDDLEGGAGSVEEYKLLSTYNNEEVGQGSEDVKVYGMSIEADDASDLGIQAMKLVFNEGTAASDFEDYATEVAIWQGDTELARLDASEFTDDNDWTKTVSFDDQAFIGAGEVESFYVTVSGIDNLDTNDATDSWTLDVTSVRFLDAQGAIISEDPTLDTRTFSFENFATAADIELKFSTGDETINDAHVIDIDATDDTNDVPILSVEVEVEGDSNLTMDALPVNFDVAAGNVDDQATAFYLYVDGEQAGQVSVGSGSDCIEEMTANGDCLTVGTAETYLFDDLDLTLEAGQTYDFEIKADLLSIADGVVDGDTIAANISNTLNDNQPVYGFDVEDEDGEDLDDDDTTGSVTGEAHALYDTGIYVTLVSVDSEVTYVADPNVPTDADQATYTIKFDVEAFGADAYIDEDADEDLAGVVANEYTVSNASNTATEVFTSTADHETNSYLVEEGTTETFTLTVVLAATADNFADVTLTTVGWAATDVTYTDAYTFNLDEFQTDPVYLNFI